MGIFVQVLHVRMCRRAVKVEVVFLDVLAVVALAIRQSEEALFEDRIAAIPQGHAKAKLLLVITDTGESIFTPVIRPRTGLIMREVVPGISNLAVVFTNCAPLALAQVRTQFLQLDVSLRASCKQVCSCVMANSICFMRI